jgi:hypothetical protein
LTVDNKAYVAKKSRELNLARQEAAQLRVLLATARQALESAERILAYYERTGANNAELGVVRAALARLNKEQR